MPKVTAEEFIENLHNALHESSKNKKENKLDESTGDPFDALRIISSFGGDSNFYSNVDIIGSALDSHYLSQVEYDSAMGAISNISSASEDHDFLNAISEIRSNLEDKLISGLGTSGEYEDSDIAKITQIRNDIEFLRTQEPTQDEYLALNEIDDALTDYEQVGNFDGSSLESAFYILDAGKCGEPNVDSKVDAIISGMKELNGYGTFITTGTIEESKKEQPTNKLTEAEDGSTIIYYISPKKRYFQNYVSESAFNENFDDMTLYNNYSAPIQNIDKEIAERVRNDMDEMGPKGLAAYIDEKYNPELYGKVKSIQLEYKPYSNNHDEGLYITSTLAAGVDPKEVEPKLRSYIEGQMSDGWGEGFEQTDFEVGRVWCVYDQEDENDMEIFSNEREAVDCCEEKNRDSNSYSEIDPDNDEDEDEEESCYDWTECDVYMNVSFWPGAFNNHQLGGRIEKCYIDGRDEQGLDLEGYDIDGYNRWGRDKAGYDREGFNGHGFDREGYDKEGFDKEGFDREGYGRDGLDRKGFDKSRTATVKNFLKVDPLQDLNHGYDYYNK